jgi:hypothetical protein
LDPLGALTRRRQGNGPRGIQPRARLPVRPGPRSRGSARPVRRPRHVAELEGGGWSYTGRRASIPDPDRSILQRGGRYRVGHGFPCVPRHICLDIVFRTPPWGSGAKQTALIRWQVGAGAGGW